jgi:GTP-binding protein
MKIKNAYFLKSCTAATQFPDLNYPEFAFFGRSNVGKSSLLNMLLGKKDLVKTGSRPGVTTMVNFFIVNDNRSFVDLPGFGYAKLPAPMRKKFMPLIKEYISNRTNLKAGFLLIDIRRTPGDFEEEILSFLTGREIPVAITITKADKLSKNQRVKKIREIEEALGISSNSIFITSAGTGEGKHQILRLINELSSRKS